MGKARQYLLNWIEKNVRGDVDPPLNLKYICEPHTCTSGLIGELEKNILGAADVVEGVPRVVRVSAPPAKRCLTRPDGKKEKEPRIMENKFEDDRQEGAPQSLPPLDDVEETCD